MQDMNYLIANAHLQDLRREADRARLARLATCCQATGLTSIFTRFRSSER